MSNHTVTYPRVDEAFQALADPIRREILRMLRDTVLPAGAIAETFTVSRPAVSRHLRVLREAGLVREKAQGRERFYRLDPTPLEKVETFVRELRSPGAVERAAWERRFMALETEVHRTRQRRKAAGAIPTPPQEGKRMTTPTGNRKKANG
jgi:DNA-binding transcriptional ArsR family regulator